MLWLTWNTSTSLREKKWKKQLQRKLKHAKKEKEDMWAKQAIELGFPTKHALWKTTKKHARAL